MEKHNYYKDNLKPLFSKYQKTYSIIGFDVETHSDDNLFYHGGVTVGGEYKVFYDKIEMIKYILTKPVFTNKALLVATNLGFDLTALFFNTPYWNDLDILMTHGRIISATIKQKNKNKKKVTFIDTMNYAPFSVAIMGDILGKKKLKSPKCLGKIPKNNKEKRELEIYNKRDCIISAGFVELLQKGIISQGGKLKITIASTAMDIFRRKYLRQPIRKEEAKIKVEGLDVNKLLFESYYGGRTEVFNRGRIENAKVYDINSLYPTAMIKEYPNPSYPVYKKQGTKELINEREGVTRVKLHCPYMKYPLLPMRIGGKLVFATGEITGVYTNVELRKALELGYEIIELGETIYYKKTFYPFKEYVLDMYEKRLEQKKKGSPQELVYKLLLNSLYGKFGQKEISKTEFYNIDSLEPKVLEEIRNDPLVMYHDDHNAVKTEKMICDAPYVLPILPSYTTAYARLILYDYIIKHNAVYCDTDSIATYDTLEESKELGGMKIEYDIVEGIFVKPKMYYIKTPKKTIIRLKGVPKRILYKNEQIRINKDVFDSILMAKPVSYIKFTKLKEGVRRGILPNSKMKMEKYITLTDNKRMWFEDFDHNKQSESKPICIISQ